MWEYIFIAIILVAVPIFRVDGPYGLDQAKNSLFILLTGISFLVTAMAGMPAFGGSADTALLLFVLYASISTLWTEQPKKALKEIVRLWAVFWFYITASMVNKDFLLLALFIPAPFISAYGLVQQIFRYDPFDKRIQKQLTKKTRFLSFLGNSNYTATYLAPQIFIGAYLINQYSSWIIIPGLIIVAAGLMLSQCRAAILSVIAGTAIILPESIPFMIIFFFIFIFKKGCRESIGHRFILTRACIELWKKRPLFGWGSCTFRVKLYRALAVMNSKDKNILGNSKKPGRYTFTQARRAHNDYAETLVEYGIAGAVILVIFLYSIIQQTIGHPFIMAGIITVMVNAFFFYPFRDTALSLPFFTIAASVNTSAIEPLFIMSPGIQVLCGMVILYISYLYAFKPFMGNYHYTRDNPDKALTYDPFHNAYLYRKAIKNLRKGKNVTAFISLEKAINNPDGEGLEYMMLNTYGNVAIINGAYHLAKRAFSTSIIMNPSNKESIQGLKQTESILAWIETNKSKAGNNGKSG